MSLRNKIKKLINVIKDTNINEIEITSFWGFQKVRLTKKSNYNLDSKVVAKPKIKEKKDENFESLKNKNEDTEVTFESKTIADTESEELIDESTCNIQKAPLVGTFYICPKPGESPYIEIGQKVSKGQTLCIIEAMKIFNEIESEFDGDIVEIFLEDNSPVEFNQPLFSIKPN